MEQQAPAKKIVGKPFQKGKSGNPNGRPKVVEHIRDLARSHGPEAFKKVVELLRSDDERVAMTAAQEILNRAYGKPTQAVDMHATHDHTMHHASEPISATAEWIAQLLGERANGEDSQPLPN